MKVLIIGGGWVGCHLAYKLMNSHDVTIFEKNSSLFEETSFKNQNRLHLGYHYPRSFVTREMCKNTFDLFIQDYEFMTSKMEKNVYSIPSNKSIIDFNTYLKIFEGYEHRVTENLFDKVDGTIIVDERHIDHEVSKKFFNENLLNLTIKKKVEKEDLNDLSKYFDIVINCTNNQIKTIDDSFFELTVSFVYDKIFETNFDSVTMVDGEFFSIFKLKENYYTVTDVQHTPIKSFESYDDLVKFSTSDLSTTIQEKKTLIEEKIKIYYPNFMKDFRYNSYFLSVKSKFIDSTSNRYPVIIKSDNIISCYTGKIQGIYVIENYINNEINHRTYGTSR